MKIADLIIHSIMYEPETWAHSTIFYHGREVCVRLVHSSGINIWTGNGVFSIEIIAPDTLMTKFNLIDKFKIWIVCKKWLRKANGKFYEISKCLNSKRAIISRNIMTL